MVLIYSDARGRSGYHGRSTVKGFFKGYFPMHNFQAFFSVIRPHN
jgi:hypothetical protein